MNTKPQLEWLTDPKVFRVNQLAAHSDHIHYDSWDNMTEDNRTCYMSLNGRWNFKWSRHYKERPMDFYKVEDKLEGFTKIDVPGHVELQGYDQIHYINTMYPWEGHVSLRPPEVDMDHNPVLSYVKNFDIPSSWTHQRTYIRFEGVEQAFYLYLNGHFIGYGEDSFTPSEFDLTPYIKEKDNKLAVEVYKRSKAAWVEDQDFFRFSGIFRPVSIYTKPKIHLDDMWAKTKLHEDKGSLQLDVQLSYQTPSKGFIEYSLEDENRVILQNKQELSGESSKICFPQQDIDRPKLWSNKTPYLYKLIIKLFDDKNNLIEVVPYHIGFRSIGLENKIIQFNGKRLIINGVNRHEWSAKKGRAIDTTEMEQDIQIILRNHINSIRTSHYPNRLEWYDLCDQNGIYLMAEVNLESHGSWQKMGAVEPSWNVPGDDPDWTALVLDRAKTVFETFKNHPSILFWSLGNESYAGTALVEMNQYFKQTDPSRLVHYEGVFHNPDLKSKISDVESQMYAPPERIEEYLKTDGSKPFILCEYMHCMGNSLGGIKTYDALLDKYPQYQGGYIWDMIDQALLVIDPYTGRKVLKYGGDFDDRPSDYEFSGNGILFADRTEKPCMQEVRYFYALRSE
ncbi:glycoside hydrolase family 2 TIM barrel-domain containing protein [Spirochaeta cellobiosiphila]|uniref:glycoside hydrolase family 2 TIM barrel-domain containing protein n=1 Tax=Spirochaeta cellobiosiphila TaxID=504483 RepID=UPI00040D5D4C|nr:glycoside hydrolase family 2 TIM barrel-domain containing protein [Spirochaeta cellobiosiphila]